MATARPRVGVFKFASCDGCQLSLLDCEDELLAVVGAVELGDFLEATSAHLPGPYDLSLVEGSITTPGDAERIQEVRRQSRFLVAIGACASSGGIQALRNFASVEEWKRLVYAKPEAIAALEGSAPISAHVKVDFELRGCPIDKRQLLEVISAFLARRRPNLAEEAICAECKRAGVPCVLVGRGTPCLGPITHAGCGALCPGLHRGCFGCFGPAMRANPQALGRIWREQLGVPPQGLVRALRTFNAAAPAFVEESERHAH